MGINKAQMFARIKKIEFTDYRNIAKGIIEFPNSEYEDYLIGGSPSIIGLYGQNGSGKSSVIMALGILKDVLSGKPLDNKYMSCIMSGSERCNLKYDFSMYAKVIDENGNSIVSPEDSSCYDVFYEFDITTYTEEAGINDEKSINETGIFSPKKYENTHLRIENEVLKFRVTNPSGDVMVSKQVLFDTRPSFSDKYKIAFGTQDKHSFITQGNSDVAQRFREIKAVSLEKSQSFVFNPKTINLIEESFENIDAETMNMFKDFYNNTRNVNNTKDLYNTFESLAEKDSDALGRVMMISVIYNLLVNLRLFGDHYLYVIDTTTIGKTNINVDLPLLIWYKDPEKGLIYGTINLNMDEPTSVSEKTFNYVQKAISSMNIVLEKIIPGFNIILFKIGSTLSEKSESLISFEIISKRGTTGIPLKYESDGIRRIVMILSLLIAVYNEASFTVAIDEMDSGIYEYLLGELLTIMSESAKGQFIFTSHNLRPLEVLPSKYLCFTTTNPANRFVKIANRGNSNLRDGYIRSIVLDTQKEQVYAPTDKYEINLALYKAGHGGIEHE